VGASRFARDVVLGLGLVAALLWQGAATAACEPPGTLSRVDVARLDQISGASGAGRRPLAAFADGDLVFAVFEKLAAIVVPPPLSGAYVGTIAGEQTTTVMLRRSRTQAFAPAATPRIRDAGAAKVVPVSRSDEHFVLQNGFATYVVLPGTPGVSAGACIDDRAALLAARAPAYAQADLTIDTAARALDDVVADVLAFLRRRGGSEVPA